MSKYIYPDDAQPNPQTVKLLALVGNNKKVLEVGCGLGYQSRSLTDLQGCEVTGIEIDPGAALISEKYCARVISGNIETLDLSETFPSERFDVVVFADVLEHLHNPAAALRKVSPLIKNGGYIVASIPNITHEAVIFELAHGKFEYRDLGILDDTHLRFFSYQSVLDTFDASGYTISAIARNRADSRFTEFKTNPLCTADHEFLGYIRKHNPEYNTYQFIIKAYPNTDTNTLKSELEKTKESLRLATMQLNDYETTISKLKSDLQWTHEKLAYRILRKIKDKFG